MCLADVAWQDGSDVRGLAAPDPARASSHGWRERGWTANAGTELEFIVFRTPTSRPGTRAIATSRPANLYNVDYSLLGTARVEPLIRRIRNSMEAAGMLVRGLQGRVQLRPARDQLPLRRCADDGRRARRSTRTGSRRSPRSGGHGDHLHGQVRRARGQLLSHPLLAGRRATGRCSTASRRCSSRSSPGSWPPARADAAAGAERQLLQALRRRELRADRRRLGTRQPHLRAARRRPRAVAALREPRRAAPT